MQRLKFKGHKFKVHKVQRSQSTTVVQGQQVNTLTVEGMFTQQHAKMQAYTITYVPLQEPIRQLESLAAPPTRARSYSSDRSRDL